MEIDWHQYWLEIANDLKTEYKKGHPSVWEQTTIEGFLIDFENELREKMRQNEEFARKCGIKIRGDIGINQWESVVPSTFRRIFSYRTSTGKKSTKHAFAIYLGYSSAEDYLNKKDLKPQNAQYVYREIPLIDTEENDQWGKSTVDISRKFLSKCFEYGFDAALVSEAKRIVNSGLEIELAELIIEIDNITVTVKKRYQGRNVSLSAKKQFHFQAFGDIPVDNSEMGVYAKNLSTGNYFKVLTNDRDLNTTKNYKLIFNPTLNHDEEFNIEIGYTLKNIAKYTGKDYLLSVLSFKEMVKAYSANIVFHDHFPRTVSFVNLLDDSETLINPKIIDKKYHFYYSIDHTKFQNLNDLRLFILYDRKISV